jgi:mRNA-degrading endonuclease RelE of RelBE toxin-antitoxin system
VPQLEALTANERTLLLEAVEQQLVHEPLVETRNRKLLRPNPIAPWELRVGELRLFYEVKGNDQGQSEPPEVPGTVFVLAVGKKEGSVLRIAGKRVTL